MRSSHVLYTAIAFPSRLQLLPEPERVMKPSAALPVSWEGSDFRMERNTETRQTLPG